MPAPSPIDGMHPSSPAYQVATAQAMAAGATVLSTAVDCEAFARAAVFVSIDQSHQVQVLASLDEVTWFNYVAHVDTVGPLTYTGATATGATAFNTVRRVELAGARFLRVFVYNTSAGAAVLNAWITLQGPS